MIVVISIILLTTDVKKLLSSITFDPIFDFLTHFEFKGHKKKTCRYCEAINCF